jgi:tetratricopeptide (TPR) repeat protein
MKRQGRFAEARAIYREALGMRERARLTESHLVAASRNNLGDCLEQEGRFEEAIPLFESAVAAIASQDINVGFKLRAERHLALCRLAAGQRMGALESMQQIVATALDAFGEQHVDTLAARHDLALGYVLVGDSARARTELEHIERQWRRGAYPPATRPLAASVHSLQARIVIDALGHPEGAERLVEAAETALGSALPDHHPQHRFLQLLRARIASMHDEDERAQSEMKSALRNLAGIVAPSHPYRTYGELQLSRLLGPKEVEARLHRFRLEADGAWLDPRLRFAEALAALEVGRPASISIAQACLDRMADWYGADHEETRSAREKLRLIQAPPAYP